MISISTGAIFNPLTTLRAYFEQCFSFLVDNNNVHSTSSRYEGTCDGVELVDVVVSAVPAMSLPVVVPPTLEECFVTVPECLDPLTPIIPGTEINCVSFPDGLDVCTFQAAGLQCDFCGTNGRRGCAFIYILKKRK